MLPYILPIAILAIMYKRSIAPAALTIPYRRGEREIIILEGDIHIKCNFGLPTKK
jgi:hypothetical protein